MIREDKKEDILNHLTSPAAETYFAFHHTKRSPHHLWSPPRIMTCTIVHGTSWHIPHSIIPATPRGDHITHCHHQHLVIQSLISFHLILWWLPPSWLWSSQACQKVPSHAHCSNSSSSPGSWPDASSADRSLLYSYCYNEFLTIFGMCTLFRVTWQHSKKNRIRRGNSQKNCVQALSEGVYTGTATGSRRKGS